MDRSFIMFRDDTLRGAGVRAQRFIDPRTVAMPLDVITDDADGMQLCDLAGRGLGRRERKDADTVQTFRLAIG